MSLEFEILMSGKDFGHWIFIIKPLKYIGKRKIILKTNTTVHNYFTILFYKCRKIWLTVIIYIASKRLVIQTN